MTTEILPSAQPMRDADRPRIRDKPIVVHSPAFGIWLGGWLFTLGFAQLAFWKAILALVIWPYFLGELAR